MRLLFIKLKHIGDALLLTPTLASVRTSYPDAHICIVVRKGCEGILAGCSAIDRIYTAAAPEAAKRSTSSWWNELQLIWKLRAEKFDYVFELSDADRGRWLAILSGARNRCVNTRDVSMPSWWRLLFNCHSKFDWWYRHRVEKDFFTVNDSLPLRAAIPSLTFTPRRTVPWQAPVGLSDYVVIHPGTRWRRKQWPTEKWIELGKYLLRRFNQIVISVGPDRDEVAGAAALQAELDGRAVSTGGKLSWAQLANVLYGAKLFVGVDTAAMHLAAACQCPTVALFGPSVVGEWGPWKVPHRVVTEQGITSTEAMHGTISKRPENTERVASADVIRACEELLSEVTAQESASSRHNDK